MDSILKDNVKQVLQALNSKMNDKGIVVYNGYAQFFNTDKDDKCTNQDWTLIPQLGQALDLTLARKKKFNDLVLQINKVIQSAISDIASDSSIKYTIGFSNWDPWVYKGVDGQFCDPKSTGEYPDSAQPNLQFFKPDTKEGDKTELKRRADLASGSSEYMRTATSPSSGNALSLENIYSSSLTKSRSPAAVALKKLDPRAPTPPTCPGDGGIGSKIPVPDSIGKNFHPNELGHVTIASFAAAELMDLRAKVLGVKAPDCVKVDKFTCWQTTGRKAYASVDRMNENYKDYCNNEMQLTRGGKGWIGSATYHKGTPDEHVFAVELGPNANSVGQDKIRAECLDSFDRIINGCDGNDKANPMDWKFGGQWVRGDNTWEITAMADKRPWPPIQKPDGECHGWYHGVWSSYEIYGSGFSTYDYGQKTLLPNINHCAGDSTLWKFHYLDPPSKEGYEWKATFDDLIWVRARCFANNKVVRAAGGFTNGCGGND